MSADIQKNTTTQKQHVGDHECQEAGCAECIAKGTLDECSWCDNSGKADYGATDCTYCNGTGWEAWLVESK